MNRQTVQNNPASHLPSPGCQLIVTLDDGREIPAIRPCHVADRTCDYGYQTLDGEPLRDVKLWRYK